MVAVPDPDFGGNRVGRGSVRHVLVVGDEHPIVNLIRANLELAGYRVSKAYTGVEALEQIALERPDLIILNDGMRQPDGYAVLKALRQNAETQDISVLMLSKKAGDTDVQRAWAAGVDGYMTVPFSPPELVAWVAKL